MNKYRIFTILVFTLIVLSTSIDNVQAQNSVPENWHHSATEGIYKGVSTEEAYALLKEKTPTTTIVAVIDSGIDSQHEDLDDVMWVNKGEIPANGKDDDNNGYVDDIHGWSFLGNASGENISGETLEETRIYANAEKFEGERDVLINALKSYSSSRESTIKNLNTIENKIRTIALLEKFYGSEVKSGQYEKITLEDTFFDSVINEISAFIKNGGTLMSYKQNLQSFKSFLETSINFYYNPEVDGRKIIKDDYADPKQRLYGNNDTHGPDPSHGTHVAGIIAGERDNNLGIKGVADNVRIMSLRTVPNGDERDKDVANAIYYAVNNGAKVINMSFGKSFSWDKEVVDKAVRYAEKKDVLLVHAAGNSSTELDGTNNFPHKKFKKKGLFCSKDSKVWLEVGATTFNYDKNFVASFSNFDEYYVDVFAPGYQIYSTTPDNTYSKFNGTSMASPMVAGVAALIRSYFPKLSAKKVREIILKSATLIDLSVLRPSDQKEVKFKSLSGTGAILNAEAAVRLALKS